MLAKQKQAEYRDNQIGIDFTICPSQQFIRVFINGQILSADNFPNTELFISYKVTLPSGWKAEPPESLGVQDLTPAQMQQYNCLESVTQTVAPVLHQLEEGGTINRFYFSSPIDLQLLAKAKVAEVEWPTIHFEVFEKDNWDKIYFQGCGFIQVPSTPGVHTIETLTWKPNLSYQKKVFEFFMGGLTRPKNIEMISKSEDLTELDNKGPVNRQMFNTISSGSVRTRLHVAVQSKAVKSEERMNFKVIKFSEETEQVKNEYSRSQIPSQVNTGSLLGGRFTTTRLNN